jgi:uncharacterized 2Fe-2S/4Fe-4S cluster protein (DUF4445 family)
MPKIKIIAAGKRLSAGAKKGQAAADAILDAGFFVERPCAGRGTCGKCRVNAKGALSKPDALEKNQLSSKELAQGIRLSCQAKIMGDAEIALPSEAVVTDKIFSGELPTAGLEGPFGVAIDLGSTTVAAFLATLKDSIIHKGNAVLNRQTAFGAEVISRMDSALQGEAAELKNLARTSMEEAASGLGLSPGQQKKIERAVVVGNSAMHHLFFGLPVDTLTRLPFQPADKRLRIDQIRLFGKDIELWVPPLIGGFVGSDTLACLIYLGFATRPKPMAAVDLGTNGEVMVSNGSEIAVASTAAGPAFEGVNIQCGMRASKGAISSVKRGRKGKLELEVIGGGEPCGISGSGLLSLANLLRKEGKINRSGKLDSNKIDLTDRVFLSQSDVREVQKAKAAVRAAFDILLKQLELKALDLDELVLTGSFGARISIDDALELGLAPEVKKDKVKVFANAAGMGAGMMLAEEAFEFAGVLARAVRHIELYADQEFMDQFIEHMKF